MYFIYVIILVLNYFYLLCFLCDSIWRAGRPPTSKLPSPPAAAVKANAVRQCYNVIGIMPEIYNNQTVTLLPTMAPAASAVSSAFCSWSNCTAPSVDLCLCKKCKKRYVHHMCQTDYCHNHDLPQDPNYRCMPCILIDFHGTSKDFGDEPLPYPAKNIDDNESVVSASSVSKTDDGDSEALLLENCKVSANFFMTRKSQKEMTNDNESFKMLLTMALLLPTDSLALRVKDFMTRGLLSKAACCIKKEPHYINETIRCHKIAMTLAMAAGTSDDELPALVRTSAFSFVKYEKHLTEVDKL